MESTSLQGCHVEAICHVLKTPSVIIDFDLGQSRQERLALIQQLTPETAAAILDILIRFIVEEGYGELEAEEKSLDALMGAPYKGSPGYVLSEDWRVRIHSLERVGTIYMFAGWPGDCSMGAAVYYTSGHQEKVDVFEHCDGNIVDCPAELESAVTKYWSGD
jgi:hypothetical protein